MPKPCRNAAILPDESSNRVAERKIHTIQAELRPVLHWGGLYQICQIFPESRVYGLPPHEQFGARIVHEHPVDRDAVDVLAVDFEIVHGRMAVEGLDACHSDQA